MFEGREERVPEQRWPLREEADTHVVALDDEVGVEIARGDGADETRSLSGVRAHASLIARTVEPDSRIARHNARLPDPERVGERGAALQCCGDEPDARSA